MRYLATSFSEHILRLISDPVPVDPGDEGLGPEWNGVVRRIIVEYFSQGSIWDLLNRRSMLQVSFVESTL